MILLVVKCLDLKYSHGGDISMQGLYSLWANVSMILLGWSFCKNKMMDGCHQHQLVPNGKFGYLQSRSADDDSVPRSQQSSHNEEEPSRIRNISNNQNSQFATVKRVGVGNDTNDAISGQKYVLTSGAHSQPSINHWTSEGPFNLIHLAPLCSWPCKKQLPASWYQQWTAM